MIDLDEFLRVVAEAADEAGIELVAPMKIEMTLLSFTDVVVRKYPSSPYVKQEESHDRITAAYRTNSLRDYEFILSCEKDKAAKNIQNLKAEIEEKQREILLLEEKA